ncbi:hypothetical protein B0H13DRAFT_1924131 [Mycena leptocephala]|nr:hypothetical protein B0H13DRAFT_1924131 [Mycena leptocephala]
MVHSPGCAFLATFNWPSSGDFADWGFSMFELPAIDWRVSASYTSSVAYLQQFTMPIWPGKLAKRRTTLPFKLRWGIPRILRLDAAHIASAIHDGPTSGMRTIRARIACYLVLRVAERVVHLSLKHAGGVAAINPTGFYDFNAAGGYQGVERLIERWLRIMGQSWISSINKRACMQGLETCPKQFIHIESAYCARSRSRVTVGPAERTWPDEWGAYLYMQAQSGPD